jgi:SNF2 family DNA or RNA helicase
MSAASGRVARSAAEGYGLCWLDPLFPYQRVGIDKLMQSPSVILADEMGLGKTIQAIAALRVLVHRSELRHALIVCPAELGGARPSCF